MVLVNQNAKLTGPDQGFLVSRLVLTMKPWERGWGKIFLRKGQDIFFVGKFRILVWGGGGRLLVSEIRHRQMIGLLVTGKISYDVQLKVVR
jgi:hypothetical protein